MSLWPFGKNTNNKEQEGKTPKKDFVVLLILDGLGVSTVKEGNAVLQAKTPFLDTVWSYGFSTLIHASGIHVGLPENYAGNSEVGHLNIGSGQVIYQSLPKINDAINNGTFEKHPEVVNAFAELKKRKSNLHLMGILSNGGVHGHIDHLFTLLDIAKKHNVDPYIHCFMDGRDTGPEDGFFFMSKLQEKIKSLGIGKIASVSGRLYAMDRDKRWERTQETYDAMIGEGKNTSTDPIKLLQDAYKKDLNDQIIPPTTMVDQKGEPICRIKDDDVMIFYNFREDRARQITHAFTYKNSTNIDQKTLPKNLYFLTMTGYGDELDTHVIFPPTPIKSSMARVLAEAGHKQMHISETEKYMHVTYFFNGGIEDTFTGEDRFNIPSPKVFDYSQTPEMSAAIIRDEVIYRIDRRDQEKFQYKFMVINLANPDMLGHTGKVKPATKGVEITDKITKDIVTSVVKANGAVVIIADHGNCEEMIDPKTGAVLTYHSTNPVPFIVVSDMSQLEVKKEALPIKLGTGERGVPTGILADVAPTCLDIIDVSKAPSMTGVNLMEVL
jgi:2,3-bisphosphoglycerate-independent phosphoglycerate mutase